MKRFPEFPIRPIIQSSNHPENPILIILIQTLIKTKGE